MPSQKEKRCKFLCLLDFSISFLLLLSFLVLVLFASFFVEAPFLDKLKAFAMLAGLLLLPSIIFFLNGYYLQANRLKKTPDSTRFYREGNEK